MSTQTDIHEVEVSIEQAKEAIETMEAVNRLVDNKDFIKVVENGYFENFASRQVMLRADPNMQDPEMQTKLLRTIDGIGEFRLFLVNLIGQGNAAKSALTGHEETLEELHNEAGA